MDVLGRETGPNAGPTATIGHYRARDGSAGAPVAVDIDQPHVGVIVGKRGYGKSYTLGVLAEELATAPGVAPVVLDPMGVFHTLATSTATIPADVITRPQIDPTTIPPRGWCDLLDVDPEGAVGGLLWQLAASGDSIADMRTLLAQATVPDATRRAVANHLSLAASWGIFDPDGTDLTRLASTDTSVIDCAGLSETALNALGYAIADGLYAARVEDQITRLPWLLIDEAHALFAGAAEPALRRVITRGRQPGVSLVLATQRPSALPTVATSQADLILSHRLTASADRQRLEAIAPAYMGGSFAGRMPEHPGDVLLVDDVTERVHHVSIRERQTPHGGDSPKASQQASYIGAAETSHPTEQHSKY